MRAFQAWTRPDLAIYQAKQAWLMVKGTYLAECARETSAATAQPAMVSKPDHEREPLVGTSVLRRSRRTTRHCRFRGRSWELLGWLSTGAMKRRVFVMAEAK
jgi:hypothetical protein